MHEGFSSRRIAIRIGCSRSAIVKILEESNEVYRLLERRCHPRKPSSPELLHEWWETCSVVTNLSTVGLPVPTVRSYIVSKLAKLSIESSDNIMTSALWASNKLFRQLSIRSFAHASFVGSPICPSCATNRIVNTL